MDRLSRFRRHKKEAAGAPGVVVPEDRSRSSSRTPSPNPQLVIQPPEQREHRRERHSPFRNLHFRSSAKRARSSPPASLPQSPTAAIHSHQYHPELGDHPANGSPLSTVIQAPSSPPRARKRKAIIPSFLTLSQQEILSKYQELTWLERSRLALAHHNPSPSFKWARIPHDLSLRRLDRYINVQPWHNNRVKLQVPVGFTDYINASPISLSTTLSSYGLAKEEKHPSRYIAMQGPKKNSVEHVWRMVVEQLRSPAVIVMLTETHEGTLEKCYPYFPRTPQSPPIEIGLDDEFSDGFRASVRCESIEPTCAGDAIELRKLVVRVHRHARTPTAKQIRKKIRARYTRAVVENEQRRLEACGYDLSSGVMPPPSLAALKDAPSDDDDDETEVTEFEDDQEEEDEMMTMSPIKPDSPNGVHISPVSLPPHQSSSQSHPQTVSTTTAKPRRDDGSRETERGSSTQGYPRNGTDEARYSGEGSSAPAPTPAVGEDGEERVIYHFLYKKWPDFGVPALEDLDSFFALMRLSREKNADVENPRIVHCSAGIGRSGTFIALEHLMRELDSGVLENFDSPSTTPRRRSAATSTTTTTTTANNKNVVSTTASAGKQSSQGRDDVRHPNVNATPYTMETYGMEEEGDVDCHQVEDEEDENDDDDDDDETASPQTPDSDRDLIFQTVDQLREQRRTMVQADSQFLFIYKVLRKLWQDKYGVAEEDQEPAAKRLEVDPFVGH